MSSNLRCLRSDVMGRMARPKGFEPLTPRFVVWCSIQLSYGRLIGRSLRKATSTEAGDIKGSDAVGKPLVRKFCRKPQFASAADSRSGIVILKQVLPSPSSRVIVPP